jgi:hypothetical protein
MSRALAAVITICDVLRRGVGGAPKRWRRRRERNVERLWACWGVVRWVKKVGLGRGGFRMEKKDGRIRGGGIVWVVVVVVELSREKWAGRASSLGIELELELGAPNCLTPQWSHFADLSASTLEYIHDRSQDNWAEQPRAGQSKVDFIAMNHASKLD